MSHSSGRASCEPANKERHRQTYTIDAKARWLLRIRYFPSAQSYETKLYGMLASQESWRRRRPWVPCLLSSHNPTITQGRHGHMAAHTHTHTHTQSPQTAGQWLSTLLATDTNGKFISNTRLTGDMLA